MTLNRIILFATVCALCLLPPLLTSTAQSIITKMLIWALFAGAFNLLAGQAGLLSFGHAAYFGIGAIATLHVMAAIETRALALPTPLLPLVGLVAGLIAATVVGAFATKRSGAYFSLVTLAIAELIHVIAPLWTEMFGGEAGLTAMRMPWRMLSFASTLEVYYLVAAWCFAGILLLWFVTKTGFGQLVRALRNNEQRVSFLGFRAHWIKTATFGLSGGLSGLAGGLLAITTETANYTLFSPTVSIQIAFFTFIGGTVSFFAPIYAAAILTIVPFLISDYTRSWPLYQGLIFMLVMLYAPRGLLVWIQRSVVDLQRTQIRALRFSKLLGVLGALSLGAGAILVIETIARTHVPGGSLQWLTGLQAHFPIAISQTGLGFLLGAVLVCLGAIAAMVSARPAISSPALRPRTGGAG